MSKAKTSQNKPDPMLVEVGQRLKQTIISRGFNQTQIARMINYSNNAISNIVNGYNRLTPDLADQLAEILDVTPDYLLGKAKHPTKWTTDFFDDINQKNIEYYKHYLPPSVAVEYDPKIEAFRLADKKTREVRLATKDQLDDFCRYMKGQFNNAQKLFWNVLEYQITDKNMKGGGADDLT